MIVSLRLSVALCSVDSRPSIGGWLVVSPEKTSVVSVPGSEPVAPTTAPTTEVLRTREQAEAYVASVCFKHGPPRLLGVELEWLLARPSGRPPLDLETLATALGPYAPTTVDPQSPAHPLPSGS